jgi:ketosteroid isomerase-like protein
MHPNEALVRSLYDAQSRGDLDDYVSHLTDDFVLHIPVRSQIAGDYRGADEVRRHFREIGQLSGETFRTSIHGIAASDDHVVALIDATASATASPYRCRAPTSGTSAATGCPRCGFNQWTSTRSMRSGGDRT